MAQLVESKTLPTVPKLVGLIGPPGQGKTTCAVSVSEGYAKGDCADTVLLAFDLDATIGLQKRNINVPIFNFAGMDDFTKLQTEIEDAVKQIAVRVREGKTKNVIVDTVSQYDKVLLGWFQPTASDNFDLYNKIGRWHIWLLMRQLLPLALAGARIVVTFQPKYKFVAGDSEKAKKEKEALLAKNKASGIDAEIDKLLGVSGNVAGELYRTQMSLLATVAKTKKPGGYDYWLYTDGSSLGFESKNRFQDSLAAKEPADLLAIFQKLEKK